MPIAPTVNPKSREVTVFVRLERHSALRSGMLLAGQFLIGDSQKLLIPANTVQPSDGHNYVWVVNKENKVHRQKVDLGQRVNAMVEVREGLSTDSQIVARGGGFLTDGDSVRVVETPKGSQ